MTDPAPLRTLTLRNVDGDLIDDVRTALAAEVARAQRAATRAAAELVAETDKDPRSGAVAIARSLATAARLAQFAENLLVAWSAGGPGLPPKVAEELVDQAAAAVNPKPRRRRTKAEIEADVAAKAAAAAAEAMGDLIDPTIEPGDPPPAGATRDEVIAATRAELDRLNGPEDPEPERIPTLEEAARAIENQGPKPEPGDRPASDDVAEALAIIQDPA